MPTVDQVMQAHTHLRISCGPCRMTMCVPWQLLPAVAPEMDLEDLIAKLRCSRCGTRPEPAHVLPWSQDTALGFRRSFKA
jgi:ribosomal protein S27AE